ncbi:hypothetical protein GA0070216_108166 [Micromonospora matsumotoense]|uniref:Uncharacterized protein n=1 Tax=Micromonospora matsumotoense TaxID=121616 RepID=A0A1C4Z5B6_9ACTN|nr:hypothetical protein [Micromonospora matsumotoense]SCF28150.1 hypothetical protein GA0070216_108166 [Micromonospora matsumotoense]
MNTQDVKAVRPMKKITVRKAGSVRLTANANSLYAPFSCWPF